MSRNNNDALSGTSSTEEVWPMYPLAHTRTKPTIAELEVIRRRHRYRPFIDVFDRTTASASENRGATAARDASGKRVAGFLILAAVNLLAFLRRDMLIAILAGTGSMTDVATCVAGLALAVLGLLLTRSPAKAPTPAWRQDTGPSEGDIPPVEYMILWDACHAGGRSAIATYLILRAQQHASEGRPKAKRGEGVRKGSA